MASKRKPRPRLYNIWICMRQRCNNPKAKSYKDYGARGIMIDPAWDDFQTFQSWALSNGYRSDLTLERRNVDQGYNPCNCCWADQNTQQANKRKRSNTKFNYIGVSPHFCKWRAVIEFNKKKIELGLFGTELEAAVARDSYIKANKLPHRLNI